MKEEMIENPEEFVDDPAIEAREDEGDYLETNTK